MKFTLKWLKNHLEFNNPLSEITDALTKLGIEVEDVKDYPEKYKEFSVGYIKSAKKHPEADKLKVCEVETSDGNRQIVCGASNAREGIYVIYAPIGAYIPGTDMTLKSAIIRGVESQGMMVSERELSLSDEHDGIIEFSNGKVGDKAVSLLGLDDVVIDVAITPNRGDLLGVRGIAKDLEAFGIGKLKPLLSEEVLSGNKSTVKIALDGNISQRFIAAKIFNVKNVDSPLWLKEKLKLIGQDSHGALVDITNYIAFDLNQPMHVYDLDKIQSNVRDITEISVRFAESSYKYRGLDKKEYILSAISPVVQLGEKIGSIGGVIGSLDTACDSLTKNVLVECAHFDYKVVALAKRELEINTESSYRYERSIDISAMEEVFRYALYLLNNLCGGGVEAVEQVSCVSVSRGIAFDLSYVNTLAGFGESDKDKFSVVSIRAILERLNYSVQENNGNFIVTAAGSRNDVEDKSTVVADILRMYGTDNLPEVIISKDGKNTDVALDYVYSRNIASKRILAKHGMYETISMSFIAKQIAENFGIMEEGLSLNNPISEDLAVMRKSLLPSLLILTKDNINRANANINIFEVANIYIDPYRQELSCASILHGEKKHKNWLEKSHPYSVWDSKSLVFTLINDLGFNPDNMIITQNGLPSYYHPFKSAALSMGRNIIGYFGEINPKVLHKMSIFSSVIAFEVFLERLPENKMKGHAKIPISMSDFMPTRRDFAFIVDKNVVAGEILRLVKAVDKKLIKYVDIFDVYEGENVGIDKKSIALRVTLQAVEKTFSESDISELSNKIILALQKGLQAKLRDGY